MAKEKDSDRIEGIKNRELELKPLFENLKGKEKELLVYKKIIEYQDNTTKVNNYDDVLAEVQALIYASDFCTEPLKPLIVNYLCIDQKLYRQLYIEALISYNNILKNYSDLAKELNIDSTLELSHLFSYLLWNGYFSTSKEHVYRLKNRLLLPSMYSFDVIRGNGVCLAYSELLNNFLEICNKESALLECYFPTKKGAITTSYRPEIKRNFDINFVSRNISRCTTLFLKGLIVRIGNHAVTLIRENNKFLIYDSTNLYVLNVISDEKAEIINGTGTFDIKPLSTLILNPEADRKNLFEKLVSEKNDYKLSRKELIVGWENIMTLLNDNISLLNDSYDNIHSDLSLIEEKTNEYGGLFKSWRKIKKLKKEKD